MSSSNVSTLVNIGIVAYFLSHIWEILSFLLLLIIAIAALVAVRRLGQLRVGIDDMDERVYRLGRMLYQRLPRREYGDEDEDEDAYDQEDDAPDGR